MAKCVCREKKKKLTNKNADEKNAKGPWNEVQNERRQKEKENSMPEKTDNDEDSTSEYQTHR